MRVAKILAGLRKTASIASLSVGLASIGISFVVIVLSLHRDSQGCYLFEQGVTHYYPAQLVWNLDQAHQSPLHLTTVYNAWLMALAAVLAPAIRRPLRWFAVAAFVVALGVAIWLTMLPIFALEY